MSDIDNSSEAERLSREAEKILLAKSANARLPVLEAEIRKLVYELQASQVKLELQNSEMRHAWAVAEVSADEYSKLFDFAPISYLILSRDGKIIKLNLSAARLLGKDRQKLVGSSIGFFISDASKPVFNNFLEHVFLNEKESTCELILSTDSDSRIKVLLAGVVAQNDSQCLVSVIDVSKQSRQEKIQLARLHLLEFAETHSLDDLLEETLNQAEMLTGSLIGFYHFVEADQNTIWLQNWSARTKMEFCRAEGKGTHYDISQAGIWTDCIKERRSVIHNDYLSLSHRKGLPPGHAMITRELLVPVMRNDKIMAVIGVGNKPSDYTDKDVECVEMLADLAWDIAERKQSQELLEKSHSLTEATLDSIQNGILVVDHHGKIIRTNRQFASMWNIPDEMISLGNDKILLDYVLGQLDDPDIFIAKVEELYRKPYAGSWDEISFRNGRVFERISKPMFLGTNPIGRVWSFLDITERLRVDNQLLEREEGYRRMFADNPQPMFIYDIESLAFLEVNQAMIRQYGYSREEFLSMTLKDIRPPEDIPELIKDVELSRRLDNTRGEWRHLTKNGQLKFVEVTAHSVKHNGRDARHILINDITERKNYEQELKFKNDELQRMNSEKDKFFSVIAHDLRSPFNAFLGFTRLMVEELPSLKYVEIQKIALSMRNSAINLFALLENLLEWSRMQRGMITFEPETDLLKTIANESIQPLLEQSRKKGVEIIVAVPDECRVIADCYMIRSVIRNIVSNAVKYSNKGGKVVVTSTQKEGNEIEIVITDNGIGMSKSMMDNLFHFEAQTNRKGTEGEPSTGLGLFICRDFIKKHGKQIRIESEEGKGSTFYFTLDKG